MFALDLWVFRVLLCGFLYFGWFAVGCLFVEFHWFVIWLFVGVVCLDCGFWV